MILLQRRLAGLIVASALIGLSYWVRHDALAGGGYNFKAVVFAPIGIAMGIFIMLFPQYWGKPETASAKIVVFLVFVIGLLAGLYNWHLLDSGKFLF